MDCIIQARHNFVFAFQYYYNGTEFPVFREISVSELGDIHTRYFAISLLDEALELKSNFQEARDLRSDIWHAILKACKVTHDIPPSCLGIAEMKPTNPNIIEK